VASASASWRSQAQLVGLVGVAGVGRRQGFGVVGWVGRLSSELAAWNVAVAAGFGYLAVGRRADPAGCCRCCPAPLVTLIVLYAADVGAGRVTIARLASHAFLVVGYLGVLAPSRRAAT